MTPEAPTTNRRQVSAPALTLAVVMLGFGVVVPVYPFYFESLGASGNELGLLIAIPPFWNGALVLLAGCGLSLVPVSPTPGEQSAKPTTGEVNLQPPGRMP